VLYQNNLQLISVQDSLSPTKQADAKTGAVVPKKDTSQWCDVGIMKGTTCVVSYYHLTSDVAQGNGDVSCSASEITFELLHCSVLW